MSHHRRAPRPPRPDDTHLAGPSIPNPRPVGIPGLHPSEQLGVSPCVPSSSRVLGRPALYPGGGRTEGGGERRGGVRRSSAAEGEGGDPATPSCPPSRLSAAGVGAGGSAPWLRAHLLPAPATPTRGEIKAPSCSTAGFQPSLCFVLLCTKPSGSSALRAAGTASAAAAPASSKPGGRQRRVQTRVEPAGEAFRRLRLPPRAPGPRLAALRARAGARHV
ncbi:PREDICTED: uncharacterized protein LOC102019103 [Chinchilla lanigera]|uniref:uncharacterized protein LOC102019103 n=1 Tax=Chinchilla lanigera TaxID=34839 RepID=UPI00038EA4FC|nr:PREDICTED: uncharacterized protein LOC102019103 [Chinchilla lanigera]